MKRNLLLIAACAIVTTAVAPAAAVNLPPDFAMLTVGDSIAFEKPVALAFAPDGRIFVSEQRGRIYVMVPDSNAADPRTGYIKQPTPFLEIEDEVLFHWDRGLLGLALDPDFENNRWVYFAYMVETYPEAAFWPDYGQDAYTRVERVQASLADPDVADESTREVLIGATWDTGIPSTHTSHTTGTLVFGDDGTLLISHGDGAHFDGTDPGGRDPESFLPGRVDPGEDVGAFRAHYLDSMSGKVLRIDPNTGEGVPSNPWFEQSDPSSARSRVWSMGLRNPYRMDVKRGSGSTDPVDGNPGLLAVSDVGWADYEEVNLSRGGEDFGWPCYEGLVAQDDYQLETPLHSACDGDSSYVTWAALTWPHGGGGSSPFPGLSGVAAVGSTFQSGPGWPKQYRDLLYVTDYFGKWIYGIELDESEQPVDIVPFATNTPTPVELRFDPFSKDLFSIDFTTGQILRYVFTGPSGIGQDPSQPVGLMASPGNSEVFLTWTLNPEVDVAGYHVFRATAPTGPWTQLTTQLVEADNYHDLGVPNDTEHWYHIVAVDAEEPPRSSIPSDPVSVIPIAKAWEWYVPHPGPTADFLAAPAPFPRRITIPDPAVTPDYDLWTTVNRAPQLRREVHPTDDFVLEARVSLEEFVDGELFHTGLIVRFADFDALLFGPHRGTDLRLERTGASNLASRTNAATALDLRVVRTGNDYSFEFREDDSQPWDVVSVYNTATIPTHAGIVAKTWDPNVGLVVDVPTLGLNELPPVAQAGANALAGPAPFTVQFSSTSFDPDGSYLAHHWDFGDGANSPDPAPAHEFVAAGPYEVVLTVTDGAGLTAADTLAITAEGNQPPTAQILAPVDGTEFINDGVTPVALSGSGSDPDDAPGSLAFDWSIDLHDGGGFTSGYLTPAPGTASSFVPDVVDAGQGVVWDVILTVSDPGGLSAADTVSILDASLPPVALLDLRASAADGANPPTVPGAASPWTNLGSAGATADATLQGFAGAGWAGNGSAGNPWRLEFDGVDDVATVAAGVLPGLDLATSLEMWVRFPADTQTRSYLVEWLQDTAAPFPGMSLAVENGQLRIFLGSWVDLAPVVASRWSRILVTKAPGEWLVELDGVTVGQGSTANLGAQTTELVLGAGTFAGVGIYSEHAAIAVAELRVWDKVLSPVNRQVLAGADASAWANPPRLDLVTPATIPGDGVHPLGLSGLDFVDGAQVQIVRAGIDTLDAVTVAFVDSDSLTAECDFTGLEPGARDVRVVNPDGQSALLAGAVSVLAPSPAILEFMASRFDAVSPPSVPSVDGPWRSTLGPDSLVLAGMDLAASGWRGSGSVPDPWRLRLDGEDDVLELGGPHAADLDTATEFSAEFWIQLDHADSVGTLLRWREDFFDLRFRLTRSGLSLYREGVDHVLAPLPRDRWCHLVATVSSDTTRLWIDGALVGGGPGVAFNPHPATLEFGRDLASSIAELRIAAVEMTPVQIASSYSVSAPGYPAPAAARVSLVASAGHLADGDSLAVDLRYDDLGFDFGLRAAGLSVHYDPNLLAYVGSSEGDFLPGTGSTFFAIDTETPGVIRFDTSLLGQVPGALGAGDIARLSFAHIVVESDTTTSVTVTVEELVDAQDPPGPIAALKLNPVVLFIHGGTVVSAPGLPVRTRLHVAAPNPFNPRTRIAFDLAAGGRTRLAVYDLSGRHVRTLVDRHLGTGPHEVVWDGTDAAGRRVASGVYLYALRPEGGSALVRKMTLLK